MKRHGILGKILSVAILLAAIFSCFSSLTASATNPTTMSFQGKVVNNAAGNVGTNVADTTYSIVFKLYTVSSGGAAIWTETQSSVSVTSGVFQVNLGSVCPFFTANACNGNTPIDFNANPNLYLGITFNGDSAGEMSPRPQLQSVPFAFNSDKLGGLDKTGFIQNTTSQQTSSNFNISGTGVVGSSLTTPILQSAAVTALTITGNAASTWSTTSGNLTLQAGSGTIVIAGTNPIVATNGANSLNLDTGAAAAINLGSNNANAINLNQNTAIAAAKTLTVTSGLTSLTGATSGDAFNVSNSTSTGNIAVFKDNATAVVTIANEGAVTFQNTTNSTSALKVSNLAGIPLLTIDTTANNSNNLLTNASIESAISGDWVLTGAATVARDSTIAYYGTNSLAISATGSVGGAKQNVALSASTEYSFAMFVRASTSNFATFDMGYSADGSTFTPCLTSQSILKNGWVRFSCDFLTSSTTPASSFIYARQSDSVTRSWSIDAVTLETAANITTHYREGQIVLQSSFKSPLVIQDDNNSSNSLQVLSSKGANVFTVDTSDSNILAGNAGFEINSSGWAYYVGTGGSGTVLRNSDFAYIGYYGLKVVTSATANNGAKFTFASGTPSVPNLATSTPYTLSWYDRLAVGSNAFTDVTASYWPDGATESVCTGINTQTVSLGGWTRHICTINSATTPTASAFILIKQVGATSHTFYVDAVQLELGSVATAYGAGNIVWSATITAPVTARNVNDSTTAVQIQNAAGTTLFGVDTLNTQINVGAKEVITANTTALVVSGAPAASATSSLVQLGSAIAGGNAATNGGTYLGINAPAAGNAGTAADFVNFQNNGTSLFRVTDNGSYGIVQLGAKSGSGNDAAQCAATSDVGKIYVNGTDKAVFACTAINVWEQLDNGRMNQISTAASYTVTTTDTIVGSGVDTLTITPTTANSDVMIQYSSDMSFTCTGIGCSPGTVTLRLVRGATCAGTTIQTVTNTDPTTGTAKAVSYTAIDTSPTNGSSNTYVVCAQRSGGGGTITDTISNRFLFLQEVDTTGADYAETYYSSTGDITPGTVVSSDSSIRAGVRATTGRYQKGLLGVVSTKPGQVLSDGTDSGAPVIVALAGRVPVKVSAENGPIEVGDALTSSSTSGVAMKATKAGAIIGTALTAYNGEGVGQVLTLVHTGQSAGMLPLSAESGPEVSSVLLADFVSGRTGVDQPVDLSSMFTDRLAAAVEIVTPKLVTDEIQTNTVVIGKDGINFKNDAGEIVASIDPSGAFHNKDSALAASPTGNATVNGNLAVVGGNSSDAKDLENALKIDNASTTATIGAAISITNSGGGGFTNIISSPNFSVSGAGDVTAKNLHVSLAADGTFVLLNPSGSSAMTVDASGNATFSGNLNLSSASLSGGLNVGGDANFAGLSTFQKLATFIGKTIFRQDVQFDAHITVASDTAGYASLRVGESSVHVTFTHAYDNPPVVSASITDGQFALSSVHNITVDGFDIALQTAAITNTTFSWTALGVNSPQTASNPLTPTP